ncbi:hypothetical protein [Bradyrhizobium sp. RT9a]|uniref:hypothetical protein n=1 Tax=Bradyrhizobium sp. RT9a TaxID=3156384 RepID=UPI00339427DF
MSDWDASVAAITLGLLATGAAPRQVVVAGWSMAGRVARSVCLGLARGGLPPIGFISLAESAPFPGLVPVFETGEPVTEAGLWDLSADERGLPTRHSNWCAELTAQSADNDRVIIPEDVYRRDYRVNTPLLLRGAPKFPRSRGTILSVAEVTDELGTFDFGSHPLTRVIAPTRPSDARHALTDSLTWGFLNAQRIFEQHVRRCHGLSTFLAALGAVAVADVGSTAPPHPQCFGWSSLLCGRARRRGHSAPFNKSHLRYRIPAGRSLGYSSQ